MNLGQSGTAFRRARWLAELATAIEAAEQAANRLLGAGPHVSEAHELQRQLRAVKREIEDLRLAGWRAPMQEIGSKRIELREI